MVILILAALGAIGFVVIRKVPQLSALHVEESPKEKIKRLKANLVVQRMMRKIEQGKKKLIAPETWQRVQYLLAETYRKIKILEEKYKVRTADAKVKMFLKRGRENIIDDPELAESCFLDVITLDPRDLEAYEGLFQIYRARKSFHETNEILEFLMKLNPASAGRYLFEVAEAMLQSGDQQGAWGYGTRAIALEAANPKYLDFLIGLAILEGRKKEGSEYLEKLREVNPENGKIGEFEERIKNLE